MSCELCVYLSCDNKDCMITNVVPISSLELPENLQSGDKIKPAIPDGYHGWSVTDDGVYCPWCKSRYAKPAAC